MHRTAADARAPRVELSPPDYLAELVERTVRVTARLGALPAASKEHAGTCAELQMLLSRQDMYTAEGVHRYPTAKPPSTASRHVLRPSRSVRGRPPSSTGRAYWEHQGYRRGTAGAPRPALAARCMLWPSQPSALSLAANTVARDEHLVPFPAQRGFTCAYHVSHASCMHPIIRHPHDS